MNILILMGSPRKNGNTVKLLKPFEDTLHSCGHSIQTVWLYDKDIHGCDACRCCQRDWTGFGCEYKDSMEEIFQMVLGADLIVLATPIYCWYCTAPMKAALDRLMYGMNKYYGEEKGPSLWAGKHVALLETCGYRPEKGSDLFEEGMRRYCKHSQLVYEGSLALRDLGYKTEFVTEEKLTSAKQFARDLSDRMGQAASAS